MIKKGWLSIAMFSLLLMGCSGGSYSIHNGKLTSSSNTISGEYGSFSGYYFKEVKFIKGDTINFHYSISTKKGSLSARLMNSSGKVINEITTDNTITITKEDTYKIRVEGRDHQGGFNLSWSNVSQD